MSAEPRPSPDPLQTVVIPVSEARSYLERLDLRYEDLISAVVDGHDAAVNYADPYVPVTAPGTLRWITTVRTLRRLVDGHSEAWKIKNPHNRPVMVRGDHSYELIVAGGTAGTGNVDGIPDVCRGKGTATVKSVNRLVEGESALTLITLADLLPSSGTVSDADEPPAGTWILLYFPTEEGIRCELALPTEFTRDGFADGWRVRVMLGEVTRDDEGEALKPAPDLGGGDVEFSFG